MNNAPETPAPNPAHIPLYVVRDFVDWAALTPKAKTATRTVRWKTGRYASTECQTLIKTSNELR